MTVFEVKYVTFEVTRPRTHFLVTSSNVNPVQTSRLETQKTLQPESVPNWTQKNAMSLFSMSKLRVTNSERAVSEGRNERTKMMFLQVRRKPEHLKIYFFLMRTSHSGKSSFFDHHLCDLYFISQLLHVYNLMLDVST